MNMEKYVDMVSPFTGGKVKEFSTVEEHEFRKETYSVHVCYYICEDTGEKFTTTGQDELLFNDLYSQYRVKHGIPFSEEIKEIRLRYKLNYSQITRILGFGANQYAQYENGQIPSESNGKMILAIQSKQVILGLLEASKEEFEIDEYLKISEAISCASDKVTCSAQQSLFYKDIKRSVYNGFKQPNVQKLMEMIKYFVCNSKSIFPTKLNKEMFYADFYHYKRFGISISGLNYQAIQFGPVPVHYNTIYDNIDSINKEIVLAHDMESTRLTCDEYDLSLFGEKEKETLETIVRIIQPMKTDEIVTESHKEDAWINYSQGNKLIPYSEAFSLRLI
jgi:transcriptional regulator with XRE-family HTH domain